MTHGNDYYVYYSLSDYVDMLKEFYDDRDTIQPLEVIAMLGNQYYAAITVHEQQLIAQGYSAG